jgi:hypothetical protein
MATKTTGAEFKRFYADVSFWPDGVWHEDVLFTVDGQIPGDDFDMSKVEDAAAVAIEGGIVMGPSLEGKEPSVEAYFKRWRKLQTIKTLVVEVDDSKMDAVIAAIKAAGGKVVR